MSTIAEAYTGVNESLHYIWRYIYHPANVGPTGYLGLVEYARGDGHFNWTSPVAFAVTPAKIRVVDERGRALARAVIATGEFTAYCGFLDWLQEYKEYIPVDITARLDYCFNVIRNEGVYRG